MALSKSSREAEFRSRSRGAEESFSIWDYYVFETMEKGKWRVGLGGQK